jgi:pilus assembly protein Flp/PilA
MQKLLRFAKEEKAATAVEYAVMLALIIAVCLIAASSLGNYANSTFTTVANAANPSAAGT